MRKCLPLSLSWRTGSKNMVIEYDDAKEAKKRYGSLRNFRSTNKLQGVFDMYRTEKTVCIIKTKKPPAKRG